MSRILSVFSIFILLSISTYANEALVINHAAPEGLKTLEKNIKSNNHAPVNSGAHGMKEYCFQSDVYFVLQENLLGKGYLISKNKPNKLVCIKSKQSQVKNLLGMHIGQSKSDIEKLLNIKHIKKEQIIRWQSKAKIKDILFDVQTSATLRFKKDLLEYLSVFTTTTN